MKLFTNLGHYFATAVSKFLKVEPKIEAGIAKVESAAPEIEAVTAAIPTYGPLGVTIEKAGEMALGAAVAVLHLLGEAAQAKFEDAGIDITTIQTVTDVYNKLPGEIKTLVSAK